MKLNKTMNGKKGESFLWKSRIPVLLLLSFRILQPCLLGKESVKDVYFLGTKIYEYARPLSQLFEEWRDLNFNTALVGQKLYSQPEFRKMAREEGITSFLIFPVFYDPEELEKHPGLFAITQTGGNASEDWVRFVCPTRPEYLEKKKEEIRRWVREYDPEGISLDFIRNFVFWEMVYPERTLESLPNSCFDSSCLGEFQKSTGIKLPAELKETRGKAQWILTKHSTEWTRWKCGWIAHVVELLAAEAKKSKPGIKINVHTVPWRQKDFGGAIQSIAGQDLSRIAPFTDFISPMCYFHMVRRDAAWIHSVVEEAALLTNKQVLPSIQVQEDYVRDPLTPAAFRESLEEALKSPSRGVVFWSWEGLEKSPEKKEIVRIILRNRLSQAPPRSNASSVASCAGPYEPGRSPARDWQ